MSRGGGGRWWAAGCLTAVLVFAGAARAAEPVTFDADTLALLLPELRKGGYVIYFRHAVTRRDQEDAHSGRTEDCATQRNLSEEGWAQALAIGAAFRTLRIPVGRVLSSPFCRAVDTARLAFHSVETSVDLSFAISLKKHEREAKGAVLRRLLAEAPAPGVNTVLVAHTANLEEAAQIWPKPEGVAVLFQPDGRGDFRVVGRVPPELWRSVRP